MKIRKSSWNELNINEVPIPIHNFLFFSLMHLSTGQKERKEEEKD
jgi:hypothetical protein